MSLNPKINNTNFDLMSKTCVDVFVCRYEDNKVTPESLNETKMFLLKNGHPVSLLCIDNLYKYIMDKKMVSNSEMFALNKKLWKQLITY